MRTPEKEPGHIFVAGASGYVGGRLVPELLDAGFAVRCLAREPRKLQERPWRSNPRVEVVAGDMSDVNQLAAQLSGCTAAYYLVHSMETTGRAYAERDRHLASNFAQAAASAGRGANHLPGRTRGDGRWIESAPAARGAMSSNALRRRACRLRPFALR